MNKYKLSIKSKFVAILGLTVMAIVLMIYIIGQKSYNIGSIDEQREFINEATIINNKAISYSLQTESLLKTVNYEDNKAIIEYIYNHNTDNEVQVIQSKEGYYLKDLEKKWYKLDYSNELANTSQNIDKVEFNVLENLVNNEGISDEFTYSYLGQINCGENKCQSFQYKVNLSKSNVTEISPQTNYKVTLNFDIDSKKLIEKIVKDSVTTFQYKTDRILLPIDFITLDSLKTKEKMAEIAKLIY